MAKDSAARIEIGRVIPPAGDSPGKGPWDDFVPLWDGTTRRRSFAERKLLEGA